MTVYTRQEILKHNTANDCWIIIRNNVYNLTPFITAHPGGADILLSRAGEDATSYFITKHAKHPHVWKQLESMQIGVLPAAESITANDFDEPFLMELIDRCYRAKLYRAPKWFTSPVFWVRVVNITVFFTLSLLALYARLPWYFNIVAVFLQALIGTSLFGFIAHEDTHRPFAKTPLQKLMLRITWPVFWPFISQNPLKYEHNSHHIKIGDPEFDYEVAAFAPVMRYSGYIEHHGLHSSQHRVAKITYPFYANIITTFGGISSGFWERHNRSVALEHSLSVALSLVYYILIPSLITGNVLSSFLLYMLYQCVLYYGIYVGAAINHFVPSAAQPIPPQHQNKYGYYVCQNTTNFCTSNPFWFWYTGGFNIQIEHHLIPFIPVENLYKMMPVVKELCSKYGYPYHSYPSFLELWRDHYTYLFSLSQISGTDIDVEMANKAGYQAR